MIEQRTARGALASNHSSVKPHFASVPSLKLSITTSAFSIRAASTLRPAGTAMLSVSERLLRLAQEIRGLAGDERRAPAAGVVAAARRLDLDDVGAHVAEHHGAQRARQDARQIDDADAGERALRGLALRVVDHEATLA